jgi:hypothetical protein
LNINILKLIWPQKKYLLNLPNTAEYNTKPIFFLSQRLIKRNTYEYEFILTKSYNEYLMKKFI